MRLSVEGRQALEARKALLARIEGDAGAWRERLRPWVTQAIEDERRGRKGAREGMALALRDALTALENAH